MSMDTEGQATPEELAAFADGFAEEKTPESKPVDPIAPIVDAPAVKEEPAQPVAAIEAPGLTSDELVAMRAAMADVTDMKGKLRDAYGRIGALNDLLHKTRDEKKAEGKPAALSKVEMKRMKEAYPELADDLSADLNEALSNLRTTQQDPDEVARLVKERVAEASHELRKEALSERHPDWEDIKKSEGFWKWIDTLPEADRKAIQTSSSPTFIASRLDVFKAQRDKGAKTKERSQERLASAIAPTGGNNASKSSLSDDEAMQKAFAEGFNA